MVCYVSEMITEFWKLTNDDEKSSLPLIKIEPLFLSYEQKYLKKTEILFYLEASSIAKAFVLGIDHEKTKI